VSVVARDATDVTMAGRVRQPIDEKAFEKYLIDNVPAVKTPVELKQVRRPSSTSPTDFMAME
jgi:hypothetical protein